MPYYIFSKENKEVKKITELCKTHKLGTYNKTEISTWKMFKQLLSVIS